MAQSDWPHIGILYGACALCAGQLRLQTHTEYITLIAFPRLTIDTRTRLSITLYILRLSYTHGAPIVQHVQTPTTLHFKLFKTC